jgi:lysine 2,3-aminomutase
VLLNGVNDCPEIMKKLVHKLLVNRVRPYYIYQCDLSRGIEHFRTRISTGIEIIERLIGHTSGMAVPRFIVDAPGGGGKIPIQPNYQISQTTCKTILRNYEGVITIYKEPEGYMQNSDNCPASCNLCKQPLNGGNGSSSQPVGLEKLLDDRVDLVSLIPKGNIREHRFKNKIR